MPSVGDHAFGSGRPFTVGVEEELFLVDALTGRQVNASTAVLERLDDGTRPRAGRIEPELHACQVELISDPCATAAQAVAQLAELRSAVTATGAGLLGSGTHPAAQEGEATITDKDRYERISALLGDAAVTPVAGLHVHVGMPDAETAIRVFNGLRRHLPLLQALAANSPFRHARDSGLASAREVTLRSWPRSGVPRAMRDFGDFERTAALLARAAGVPDYTWFWWKLRPHPRLGTVEVRALDVQATPAETEGLATLIHGLARAAADADPDPGPSHELIEEGLFRAARFGTEAELPDDNGDLHPAAEVLARALEQIVPYAGELATARAVDMLVATQAGGGGAGRQRDWFGLGGMDTLLRELTRVTGEAAAPGVTDSDRA